MSRSKRRTKTPFLNRMMQLPTSTARLLFEASALVDPHKASALRWLDPSSYEVTELAVLAEVVGQQLHLTHRSKSTLIQIKENAETGVVCSTYFHCGWAITMITCRFLFAKEPIMKRLLITTACALALSTTFAAAQMSGGGMSGSGMGAGGMGGMSNQQGMGNQSMGMNNGGMQKPMMMKKKKKMSKSMMRKKRMRSM